MLHTHPQTRVMRASEQHSLCCDTWYKHACLHTHTHIGQSIYNPSHNDSHRRHFSSRAVLLVFRDRPGEQTIGRMAGTGTAVGGTGTNELGCQLRWRFFGGPEFMAEDTEHQTQTERTRSVSTENRGKITDV